MVTAVATPSKKEREMGVKLGMVKKIIKEDYQKSRGSGQEENKKITGENKIIKESRGLSISITIDLLEELLINHIKNVPTDIKFVSVERELYINVLKFYFKSKQFPVIKDRLKGNVVSGRVEATTDKDGKLVRLALNWRDPKNLTFFDFKKGARLSGY